MYIKDGIYRSIKPQVALPIAEGTVLTVNGLEATAETAFGIVPANIQTLSPTQQIYVAISGTIDLGDPANKGVSFSDDMIKALGKDFNFVPAKEYQDSPIPPIEAGDSGKVLTAGSDGTASWESGGGGGAIILYPVPDDTPSLDDLPALGSGLVWEFDADDAVPLSRTPDGPALTYTEMAALFTSGQSIWINGDTDSYFMPVEMEVRLTDSYESYAYSDYLKITYVDRTGDAWGYLAQVQME